MSGYSQQELEMILKNSGGRCRECGHRHYPRGYGRYWEVDHIIPKVRGGLDEIGNLAVACVGCNRSKSDSVSISDVMDGLTGYRR